MIFIIAILGVITFVYVLSLGWIIWGFSRINKSSKRTLAKKSTSKVSVIIPARNEENTIITCLSSLEKQNFSKEYFEVIIVNDHSSDNTESVVKNYIQNSEMTIKYLVLSDSESKKEALALGINNAFYEIIATTDADCTVPENWLKNIVSNINIETNMLLGPIAFKRKSGFFAEFQVLDMLALQGLEFGALGFDQPILNNAANLAYSRKSLVEVNGFDEFDTPSGDDVFLLEKFTSTKKGVKGILSRDHIVLTEIENNLSGFLNQRVRWASKSKYYSNKVLIFFSAVILIQNMSLVFIYLGIPLVEKYSLYLSILLFSKWLFDFILLFLVAGFFNRKRSLFYFVPVQLLYPIYILVVWVACLTMKFEWKERNFNG